MDNQTARKSGNLLDSRENTEKAMAPHSSTLAWKIPWTEELDGVQSMGSQRLGHEGATNTFFSQLNI